MFKNTEYFKAKLTLFYNRKYLFRFLKSINFAQAPSSDWLLNTVTIILQLYFEYFRDDCRCRRRWATLIFTPMEDNTKLDATMYALAVSDVSKSIFGTWFRGLAVIAEQMSITSNPLILTKLEKPL